MASRSTPLPPLPELKSQLTSQGFVILPSFLRPDQLSTLRAAAAELTDVARSGHWPHVRTIGKQFPPWPTPSPTSPLPIWGVQHLLHPHLPISKPSRDAFTHLYFNTSLLSVAQALIPTADADSRGDGEHSDATLKEQLVMELFNMLIDPPSSFSLRWHRDAIPWSASPSEETEALSHPAHHTQYNLPLHPDSSLILIPRSHSRPRVEAERAADPYDENMPGAVKVELQAGDLVFYDNNILHRGVYEAGKERATLHGSVGHVKGSEARARNVLQHGVGDYVGDCDFRCLGGEEREMAEGMRRRLVEMGRDREEVGFCLDG